MRILRYRTISKATYDKVILKYKELAAIKAIYSEKKRKYDAQMKYLKNAPIEELLPYKSAADIELDVRVESSSSHRAPQESFVTISFDAIEEELMELAAQIADLEEALLFAIDDAASKAVGEDTQSKIKRALERHLIYGLAKKDCGIDPGTLNKYLDYVVESADMNLRYIESRNRRKQNRFQLI